MAITITRGHTFADGDILLATNLHKLIESATISGITGTELADNIITTAKLVDGSVTADKLAAGAVSLASLGDLGSMKVLGNVTGVAATPAEVSILDEDDMSSNSDTALCTQQSVKKYVDDKETSILAATSTSINGASGSITGSANTQYYGTAAALTTGTKFKVDAYAYAVVESAAFADYFRLRIQYRKDSGTWTTLTSDAYISMNNNRGTLSITGYIDVSGAPFSTNIEFRVGWYMEDKDLIAGGRYGISVVGV